jgi:RNA polymerase sigma factor (sigma-70 family)
LPDNVEHAGVLNSPSDAVGQAAQAQRERLRDFIRQRVRLEEDAEDILQDVFLQLISTYNVTEPIEHLTAWLFTAARNKVIDWYRKRRMQTVPVSDNDPDGFPGIEEFLLDPAQDPDRVYASSLFWREFTEALEQLPDDQRKVFVMHELEGKSFRQIAESTGEPLNTLLSRKRYALLALRARLQDLYDESETP